MARNPEAVGCAQSCLHLRRYDPRRAAACLDACPGSSSEWGAACETAPPGSGCYVLTTRTLRPSPDKIADVIVAMGEVAEAVDDMHEDDDDEPRATRSSSGGSRERHAAKPKRASKPKHKSKRKTRRELKREPTSRPRLHRK